MKKKTIVIGFLGTTLDQGLAASRWNRWRPTVALGKQDDLLIDRLELLYSPNHKDLAEVVIRDLGAVSPETTVVGHDCHLRDPWDFEEVYTTLFDFAKNYAFDPENEDYLVHITTGTHVVQICLFLLIESHHIPARILQASPPRRDSKSTAGSYGIIDLDLSRYDKLAARFQAETTGAISFLKSGIETKNKAFNELIERLEKVGAESPAPILLAGPTGAGKSRLARRVYELRRERRLVSGDFVEVNCATIRGDAAMSTLFGHKKGAFTGAAEARTGLLLRADSGLLFLDEIGELGADEQAMLLRAIEEKRFFPMGSDSETRSDFQLICGTNQNLMRMAAEGRFREDLLARVNLWTFHLPGLRERPEDIEPNIEYELRQYTMRTGRHISFNKEARERYLKLATAKEASWRGNFRDLSASLMRMATLASGGRINLDIVLDEWRRLEHQWREMSGGHNGSGEAEEKALTELIGEEAVEAMDLFDQAQLAAVVKVCRQSRSLSEAGRKLFARSRLNKARPNDADRLRKFLAGFGLSWGDLKPVCVDKSSFYY